MQVMQRRTKFMVLVLAVLLAGISVTAPGCKWPWDDDDDDDGPTGPTTTTLLNTSVAVNQNTVADGDPYSANVFFTATAGKVLNISATGPANVDIDLFVYFPGGSLAYQATGTTLGSEQIPAFVANVGGQYRLRVRAYTQVGCTINVLVTQGS